MDLQADKDPDQVQQGGRSSGSEFVCCTEDNAPGIQAPGVFFYESPHQQAMGVHIMSSGPRLPRPSKDSVDQSSTSPQESASAADQRPEMPQRNPVHRALQKWGSRSR